MSRDHHDIVVKAYLAPAEWLALRDMAECRGLSHSSFVRQLVCHAIRIEAQRRASEDLGESTGMGLI